MNSFLRALPRTILVLLCGMALSAVFFLVTAPPRGTVIQLAPAPSPAPILVQVEGAVARPGLYPLPRESRVADAVAAAGGLTTEADPARLNTAARLKDGEKLVIPALGETQVQAVSRAGEIPVDAADGASQVGGASQAGGDSPAGGEPPTALQPLNLNTATLEELDMLPGIGPTRAQDILNYREQHGGFRAIEELQEVSGIGPATFERLKALVSVE